jgi:hypothetical protein
MNTPVIYALCEPGTDDVRYVGQAVNLNKRLMQHYAPSKLKTNTHHNNWIKSIKNIKQKANVFIICEAADASELDQLEMMWISNYRILGANLTNYLDGGNVSYRGKKISSETKKKMSQASLGKYKRIFSLEEELDIIQMYENLSRQKIREKYSISNQTISRILKDNNITQSSKRPKKKFGCRKLTDQQVINIRKEYIPCKRGYGYKSLSIKYGVSDTTIKYIINYKSHTYL